jgi:hypothetical protein
MPRYGIATVFEDVPDGYEFTEANTPLHLTHVDACEINLSPGDFIAWLRQYLQGQPSFNVIPTSDVFFGPNKDIPVTIIEPSSELTLFHNNLIQFLESSGAAFDNPQFLKQHYAPHVSIYGSRHAVLGQPLAINSVSVGNKRTDIENPPNRIIATIPLA